MILTRLRVSQLRAFHEAEVEFQPGMNLIVGVNGVGKSTILDALRIALSRVGPKLHAPRVNRLTLKPDDIQFGQDELTLEMEFKAGGFPFRFELEKPRERYVPDPDREGEVRGQTIYRPGRAVLKPNPMRLPDPLTFERAQPLAVYFSPRRSLTSMAAPSRQSARGGLHAAFANALMPRELRLREFIEWWIAREALGEEGIRAASIQRDVLEYTVSTFLDGCDNLRVEKDPEPTLLIDKAGATLDVRQLSDGERGALALVLDLTRRLIQIKPEDPEATRNVEAVVLIDELDLHLHPQWQRSIVRRLTSTFLGCQFIATTHSPQIISEVEPDSITLLYREGDRVTVQTARQSYGLASNWILKHIMNDPARPLPAREKIEQIEQALEVGELDDARGHLTELRQMLHGPDDEVTRLEASINNLEALADEVD